MFMNLFQFSPSWGGERPIFKKVHAVEKAEGLLLVMEHNFKKRVVNCSANNL